MTTEEKLIDYITKHYRGNKNPITAGAIADALNPMGYNTDAREIQQLVSKIRREKKALIGSSSAGFFLILTDEDMAITQAYIKSRISAIIEAAQGINDMWKEQHGAVYAGDLFTGIKNVI